MTADVLSQRVTEEIGRLSAEVEQLRAKQARILKLERRIHNQRIALRQNWEIVEMRAGYARHSKEVRSRMLAGWSRAAHEARELRKRVAELETEYTALSPSPFPPVSGGE